MKKLILFLIFNLVYCNVTISQMPGFGFATYIGIITAYRFPIWGNAFVTNPVNPQFVNFVINSSKATGYNGLRRLRGFGYLGINTDKFENNDTHKFMQLRLVDHLIPDHNSARIGWRYTRRPPLNVPQFELGLYAHINHLTNTNHGREGHTFGLPTYQKGKLFEYSLIVGRSYGMAARIQYQGIDSTVWIVRTLEDWQSTGFTLTDAEPSLYAKKGNSSAPNPLFITAFSASIITPYYTNEKFWHRNVCMINTWVKSGEIKTVSAANWINLVQKGIKVNNKLNSVHPNKESPYLQVDPGGALFIMTYGKVEGEADVQATHSVIHISHGGVGQIVVIP